GLVLLFIGTLMLSVLLGNGMAIVLHGESLSWTEPVSSLIAFVFSWLPGTAAAAMFYVFWWVHTVTILAFLVYVPQSKHAHLIAAPINVFLSKRVPGKLKKVDFDIDDEADEDEISFGVGKVEDFEQHQMIDFYACVECGRCTDVCPASGTGKMLSPMDIMIKVRDHLTEKGAAVTGKSAWVPEYAFLNTKGNLAAAGANVAAAGMESVSLIGDVSTQEELESWTTCIAGEDACPVMNEHVSTIIDMRRYLIMTECKMDPDAQRAVMNIERQGNPWGLSKKYRVKWREQDEEAYIPTIK